MTALISAAMLMLAQGSALAEADYLRLRPQKEPATCADSGRCPLVSGPRVDDHQRSTIPGIQNPDRGRPPVIVVKPLTPRATTGFRSFGGNRGISGNP